MSSKSSTVSVVQMPAKTSLEAPAHVPSKMSGEMPAEIFTESIEVNLDAVNGLRTSVDSRAFTAQELPSESMGKLSKTAKLLKRRLRNKVGKAIIDFNMIADGDRIMVCLSGGKDSYTLLDLLLALQKVAPITFSIHAVNLDQKQPGFPEEVLPDYLTNLGVSYHIIEQDTYSVVKRVIPDGKTTCGLCSRMRRGALYAYAKEQGITKIALGHHRDDIVETFFLNLFHGGQLKAMPAKYTTQDGAHQVIRPLAYCAEKEIAQYARARAFPIIPCNLCGSQINLQRQNIKLMLQQWEKESPGKTETMFRSLKNVVPSHLLDKDLQHELQIVDVPVDR